MHYEHTCIDWRWEVLFAKLEYLYDSMSFVAGSKK
jgi:hypothetical protein